MLIVGSCNVVAILSMADMNAETVECMSWVCMVCQSTL